MKTMKRISSLMLVVAMLFAMATTAMAAYNTTDGTIKISGTTAGATYSAYKVMDLDVNTTTGAYRYKTNTAWKPFIDGQDKYFDVDGDYVSKTDDYDDAAAAIVAKAAEAYAETNHITATKTVSGADTSTEITGLDCGYYLVSSSNGVLNAIGTLLPSETAPSLTLSEKNELPLLAKGVANSESGTAADTTTASIGGTVYYTVTVTAKAGAEKYKVVDTLAAGLTAPAETAVKVVYASTDITSDADVDITVAGQVITVDLTKYCAAHTIAGSTEFVITYPAVLNADAAIAGTGNTNTAKLAYGDVKIEDTQKTATATVYTYAFDLVKTDSSGKVIEGATFKLYSDNGCTTEIPVVKLDTNTYKVAASGAGVEISAGRVTIQGLGNGTYYVKETAAPAGYIMATDAGSITIADANNTATVNTGVYESGGVQVVNTSGTELPDTGGIGTTIFYAVGAILMIGAGAALVGKKRRDAEN